MKVFGGRRAVAVVRRALGFANRRSVASGVALSVAATAVVVAAVQSDGSTATNVRLDDGSVWVVNRARGEVGRLNLGIDELDFAVKSVSDAEVVQETVMVGSANPLRTVVFSGRDGGVQRLDVVTGRSSGANEIPVEQYHVGGGVAAVLDSSSGRLWTGSAQQVVAPEYPDEPDAQVAPGSRFVVTRAAVDTDGRVVEPGRVIIVDDAGWYEVALGPDLEPLREPAFAENTGDDGDPPATAPTAAAADGEAPPEPILAPEITPLGVDVDDIAAVSAVGPHPVVLLADGKIVLSDGREVDIPGDGHALQQTGPLDAAVLVASDSGLFEVDLDTSERKRIAGNDGVAAAPVRVGPCAFGAWSAAQPTWARVCPSSALEQAPIPGAEPNAELVFRVNQSNVALNSPGNGDVWADHDGALRYVGNWADVGLVADELDQPDPSEGESRTIVEKVCIEGGAAAPISGDDQLGVRPRQSIVNVLSNDDDLNCEPIAIRSVEPTGGEWGDLTIIDHGQHLLYSPSDEWVVASADRTQTFQFTYVTADIAGNESSPATVTITVKDAGLGNVAPTLRPKGEDSMREMRTVVEEGRSVSYNVLPDWWDPDGDDLRLVSAVAQGDGEIASTPDGLVRFGAAGVGPGIHNVDVTVSDGRTSTTETLEVTVKPIGSAIAPVTADDFITIVAGDTGDLRPLDNDSDPNEDPLTIRPLWTEVADAGYTARVDGDSVEIVGHVAGVYALGYEASDGVDATAATIRLEVVAPSGDNQPPIAVPDQVKLRADRIVNVDVLANDVDADGDLLAVTDVQVVSDDPSLGIVRATPVDRRMVQVEVVPGPAGELPTGPFTLTYVVSDGREAERAQAGVSARDSTGAALRAQGAVTVLVQPPTEDQPPLAEPDATVVRTGDIVGVPVLRNDVDPDSDPLTLVGVDEPTAAQLEAAGSAVVWVDGREVFVRGGTPGTYEIFYRAEAGGKYASGLLTVRVTESPDVETNPNRAPEPPDLALRAVRNGSVRVRVSSFGVDPDGDSVVLLDELGLPTEPGNRVALDPEHPGVVWFTAGPRSGPRDSFTYTVQDRFGERGTATVDVMVLDDAGWAPQAHDDVFAGKPGRVLSIPVVANDTSPQDRPLEIAKMPFFDADGQPSTEPLHPDRVTLLDQENPDTRGRIEVEVPTDGVVLVEHYRIFDGLNPGDAFIRVTPDPDAANLPPVASPDEVTDDEVTNEMIEVVVDVLANDFDPDDAAARLELSLPANQNAELRGRQVAVPLTRSAQTILYRVTDADGAERIGIVTVPGLENHPPQLSEVGADPTARVIDAATGEPMTIALDVITEDPDGDPAVELTDTEVVLSGPGGLVRLDDGSGFVYTPPEVLTTTEIVSIRFEVTDRPNVSLAERQLPECNCVASLTTQVTVESSSPPYVLGRGAVNVPQLDEPTTYDLAPLTADDQGDALSYTLDDSTFGGLEVTQDGSRITVVSRLADDRRLPVGTRIPIRYTVADDTFEPVENTVVVTIVTTNKGRPAPASFATIEAERDVPHTTPNVVDAAFNPFAGDGRPLTLISSSVDGGASAVCSEGGDCEFVSNGVGTFTLTYTLADAVGQTATGTLAVVVKGKPLAPGVPSEESVGDGVVNLSWTAADDQGSPITAYHVTAVGAGLTKRFDGNQLGGPFDGLTNATTYRFEVVAENALGMGEPSGESTGMIPDRVPDAPENLRFTDYRDQTLTLAWDPPSTAGDYSAIVNYEVTIGGTTLDLLDGGTTSIVVGLDGVGPPLQNGQDYTFTVKARNSAPTANGFGEATTSSSTERPSRHPGAATKVVAANAGDGGTPRVTVDWDAPADDGGRAITHYVVTRDFDGATRQVDASEIGDGATFDQARNTSASFTVVAYNSDKNRNDSDVSAASAAVVTVGVPDAPVISGVVSGDHRLTVNATSSNGSGCNSYSIMYKLDTTGWQASNVFTGLTNGQARTATAKTVLGAGCYSANGVAYESVDSNAVRETPLGPLRAPTMTASRNGTTISWSWTNNAAGNDDSGRNWTHDVSGSCAGQGNRNGGTYSRDFGYGPQTYTCTVTISAPGVSALSANAGATTPAPPPPTLTGRLGESYNPSVGSCSGSCRRVYLTGANFTPNSTLTVTCFGHGPYTFTTAGGSGAFNDVGSVCALTPGAGGTVTVQGGGKSASYNF